MEYNHYILLLAPNIENKTYLSRLAFSKNIHINENPM